MFKKILFPVDFSEASEHILPYVLSLAEKYQAQLHTVYVTRDMSYFTELDVPYPSIYAFNQDIKQGAEKTMRDFCQNKLAGHAVGCQVLIGDPATELVNFIEENDIDLVVMGTHGRKGINRLVFGSVAESLIRNSPVPVMTVRPPETE